MIWWLGHSDCLCVWRWSRNQLRKASPVLLPPFHVNQKMFAVVVWEADGTGCCCPLDCYRWLFWSRKIPWVKTWPVFSARVSAGLSGVAVLLLRLSDDLSFFWSSSLWFLWTVWGDIQGRSRLRIRWGWMLQACPQMVWRTSERLPMDSVPV